MRVSKQMTIAGLPAVAMRDVFKALRNSDWDIHDLSRRLGVSPEEASNIADSLVADGYIELVLEHDGGAVFTATTKGAALSNASAAKPITRKTADRLVKGIVERAAQINATPHFLHHVTKVYAFGSYLTDRIDLGDIDVAVELRRKVDGEAFISASQEYADRLAAQGQRFPNFTARLFCAEADLYKTLRGGSRAISIHEAAELAELEVTASQVIYEHP